MKFVKSPRPTDPEGNDGVYKDDRCPPKGKALVPECRGFYKPGAARAVFQAIGRHEFYFLYDNSDNVKTRMSVFDYP